MRINLTRNSTRPASRSSLVTVTDSSGCSNFTLAVVSDQDGPTISVNSVNNVTCHGNGDGAIFIDVTGGVTPYTYSWSNGASTEDIINLCDGTYTVNVTDAKIATMASSKLTGALPALDGSALTNLPYDTAFTAGFDADMVKENLAVATYGELVMARAGTFVGEAAYIDTVCTGANVIVDIEKNGTTIYSTKPSFSVSTATVTPGVISVTTFVSGDRITFKVTQIGSSATGQGVRFTLKGKV